LENKGKKIIKFHIGDPDQDTDPRIIEAAFNSLRGGKTKYSSAIGEKTLREKLGKMYGVDEKKVIITPGSKWAIFSILFSLLKKGDNVIVPSPHWISYELILKRLGIKAKFLKTDINENWKIDTNEFCELIDENTKLIILNNPNNPTSRIIDNETLKKIVDVSNSENLTILSDETYLDISYNPSRKIFDFDGDHIMVNSFSKTFAMTGWRIGYAILNEELKENLTRLNQITITNVPTFIQEAAIKALELKEEISKKLREIYSQRTNLACKILSNSKLKFSRPDAPFYMFPRLEGCDSEKLSLELIDNGVAVAPGTSFGDYRDCFRISLTRPENEIELGLEKIVDYI
jgi:aspartate aminotransferase